MAPNFKKVQFKDGDGKEPSEYIRELLLRQIDVMRLAIFICQIPNEGTLLGTPLRKLNKPPVGIWVVSKGRYHLYYSYFKRRNEVCFLYLVKGSATQQELSEAINRVKSFYII